MRTFSSAQVARAAGMSHDNFRKQFASLHWQLFTNERPENGKPNQFTLDHVLVYALARQLSRCGFTSGEAFTVALFGLRQSAIGEFKIKPKLFDEKRGNTLFIAYPRVGNSAAHGTFRFARNVTGLDDLFMPYGTGPGTSGVEQFVVLNLSAIRDRVVAELAGDCEAA